MSFQAMSWAVAQKTSNAGQKLVLLMLANYCNSHTGQCNPSHKRLAEECSMGLSTLKGHVAALEAAGLLKIVQKSMDGVSLPNQYELNIGNTGGVGQNLADGGSESGRGVGQNLATNQEHKPGREPIPSLTTFERVASPPEFDGENAEALNGRHVVPLAKGWDLPTPWGEDAEALGFKPSDVIREAEKFRQYWVSGKGAGTRRNVKGWRQCWSNWLAKAAERAQR